MLFDERGYFLLQGRTTPENRKRDEAEFKRLANTFRVRNAAAAPRDDAK